LPGIYDTIHGADDNASGVCAVLESARLLANMNLDYTVIFVAFDEEELGLYGSKGFADSCLARNENIIGVINLDMIGYDKNNDSKSRIVTDTNSQILSNIFSEVVQKYKIGLNPVKVISYSVGSDHYYFWENGFKAITSIEDDFNAYYHTVNETFDKFNVPYFHNMVKAAVGFVLTLALDKYINVELAHIPLESTLDTSSRIAKLRVKTEVKIADGQYAPRLYYKAGNGNYNYINSYTQNHDTLYFLIPGLPPGTKVNYYFALQNTTSSCVCTLPSGGTGISPPGTTPPQSVYEYYVLASSNNCSYGTPKIIEDNKVIKDTIHIERNGLIKDLKLTLNINHTNDGDLVIVLYKSLAGNITLASSNGEGGQNFINTIFDDTASLSISQGIPPFSGRYKPIGSLSAFKDKQLKGDWIIQVLDKKAGDQGTLVSWCLDIIYGDNVGIYNGNNEISNKFELYQNYPNPFNPSTNIRYQIAKNSFVTLKVNDMLGREVETLVNEFKKAGEYDVTFQAGSLPSGVYVYKLTAGDFISVKRMVLIK